MLVVKGWTEYEHTGHGGQLADDIQTSVTGTSTLTEVRPCFVSVHHSGSNNNCHTQYRTNFWTQVLIECIPFTFTTKPLFTQKIFTHHSIMCCELDHQGCPLVSCHCLRLYKGHVLHEYNIYFMLIMYSRGKGDHHQVNDNDGTTAVRRGHRCGVYQSQACYTNRSTTMALGHPPVHQVNDKTDTSFLCSS